MNAVATSAPFNAVASIPRIEICGGIASGKTTLAKLLAERLNGGVVLEDFRRNPFWQRFYQAPTRFVREKNVCFLAQHAGDIKAADGTLAVCDYAVVQDLAYARLVGEAEHMAVMEHLHAHLYDNLPPPRLIVHLLCDATVELERIHKRGRPEEQSITLDYLSSLDDALQAVLTGRAMGCRVVAVRSDEVDFVNDTAGSRALLDRLAGLLEIVEDLRAANLDSVKPPDQR